MQTERIIRRKLSDEVLERLLRLISEGNLMPGDAMPSERALMERFGVGRPAIREAMQSLANMGLVSISHGERARVQESLKADGIPFGVYYPKPLHHQPAYAASHAASLAGGPPDLPVSEALCHQVMSLPMHPYLTEAEVERVCAAVLRGLE